jgi:hypothetical protein
MNRREFARPSDALGFEVVRGSINAHGTHTVVARTRLLINPSGPQARKRNLQRSSFSLFRAPEINRPVSDIIQSAGLALETIADNNSIREAERHAHSPYPISFNSRSKSGIRGAGGWSRPSFAYWSRFKSNRSAAGCLSRFSRMSKEFTKNFPAPIR